MAQPDVLPTRRLLPLAVALPAVAVAAVGLWHPVLLTPDTADRWRTVHLVLLPVLPLLGASVWLLLHGERGLLAWSARLLAAGYAVLYTALDSIAGIGAGHQMARAGAPAEARPPIEDLFAAGDPLGRAGVVALAVSLLLAAVCSWRRTGSRLVPVGAALAVASCYLFLLHHVFPPRGVLALTGLAVGLALLAVGSGPVGRRPEAACGRPAGATTGARAG